MEKILELKNIHKNFRLGEDDIEVLNGIEISIQQGETFAIVGPSGSCLLYTSPSPRDRTRSRMPSSA